MTSPLVRARNTLGTSRPALWALSQGVCFMAPYFRTIRPRFTTLEPGHVSARMRKRRRVTNHIGTVHAIAMCNMAELVGGVATDLLVPDHLRWIPVGMEVSYVALAKTDLSAACRVADRGAFTTPGDVVTHVVVIDTSGKTVFEAQICMRISERKRR
jgi:acyl-coenzyme A thioesterase PaaI-like protein